MTDNDVLRILGVKNGKVHPSKCRPSFLKEKGIYDYIINRYPDSSDLNENLYRIIHGLEEKPKCKVCGKPLSFKYWHYPKKGYCSVSCSRKDFIDRRENIELNDDIILKDLIKEDGSINNQKVKEKYLNEHGYTDYLNNRYPDSPNWTETVYRMKHHIDIRPVCQVCGRPALFLNFDKGYSHVCAQSVKGLVESVQCKRAYEVRKESTEVNDETILKVIIQPFEEKGQLIITSPILKKENLQKLGFYNYLINRYPDSESIIETLYRMRHNIEKRPICKHCGENYTRFTTFKEGYKEFCSSICSSHFSALENMKDVGIHNAEFTDKGQLRIKGICPNHAYFDISYISYRNRLRSIIDKSQLVRLCPICYPERSLETTIESCIKLALIENAVGFQQHNRKVLHGKELDFFIPSLNIGIECNGIFWHSLEQMTDPDAHIKKYHACKEQGITLLYFWEQDIHTHATAIKNIIGMMMGRKPSNYSNEGICKTLLPSEEVQSFINDFSLYETKPSPINLTIGDPEKFHSILGITLLNDEEARIDYYYTKAFDMRNMFFNQLLTNLQIEYPQIKSLTVNINKEYQTGMLFEYNGFEAVGGIEPKTYSYHLTSHQRFENDDDAFAKLGKDVKHLVHYKNLGWDIYRKQIK